MKTSITIYMTEEYMKRVEEAKAKLNPHASRNATLVALISLGLKQLEGK